jgi:hypothetical protein
MNINELFEKIQDKFLPEELSGEFQLNGNCIIWTYNLENNVEEIPTSITGDDEDELQFDFDSLSTEELLQEACDHDREKIEELLDILEESDNWTFSDSDIIENNISFKIF